MTPQEKMARARAELVMDHPFFGALALRLRLAPDPACAGMWTDGRTLGYRPALVEAMAVDTAVGLLAHEVLHIVCAHHLRRLGRDETLWNRACDHAVNGILKNAGFVLPSGALFDPQYAERSVDDIFAALLRRQEETRRGGGLGDGGREEAQSETAPGGGGHSDADGQAVNDPEATAEKPQAAPPGMDLDERSGKTTPTSGDAESPDAPGTPDPGLMGEVRDHPGQSGEPSPRHREDRERELRVSLAQAMNQAGQAGGMGELPAGLVRLVEEVIRPRLDWKHLLRRFIEQNAVSDYSWLPPNRRYVHLGLILPSLKNQELPEIVLAIDSSGSVSRQALSLFCAELSAILSDFDTRITVLFCDAKVRQALTFSRFDLPLHLEPDGGGGTDFRPAFAKVAELGLRPACLIYLTDLECDRFPARPDYPVLWAAYGPGGAQTTDTPPFGEVVRMGD
ncbi:MAG: VWA-like domain-containing protein [Desulfovibrionaceae bacterium]|nr:VWA-like domain-containing protein [Desulfovibrionaceae bacterium]